MSLEKLSLTDHISLGLWVTLAGNEKLEGERNSSNFGVPHQDTDISLPIKPGLLFPKRNTYCVQIFTLSSKLKCIVSLSILSGQAS